MSIQPIVEGHGDVHAVPVLLRRLRDECRAFGIDILQPIRRKHSQLLEETEFRRSIELARLQHDCRGILVLFEDEDGCPARRGPQLHRWGIEAARGIPCAIALAHREYEAWFLASIESLQGKRGIRKDASTPVNPESIRGAKEALERLMVAGRSYLETTDQAALSALFDLETAYRRSRSFRHLVKVFGELVLLMGYKIGEWPPPDWSGNPTKHSITGQSQFL